MWGSIQFCRRRARNARMPSPTQGAVITCAPAAGGGQRKSRSDVTRRPAGHTSQRPEFAKLYLPSLYQLQFQLGHAHHMWAPATDAPVKDRREKNQSSKDMPGTHHTPANQSAHTNADFQWPTHCQSMPAAASTAAGHQCTPQMTASGCRPRSGHVNACIAHYALSITPGSSGGSRACRYTATETLAPGT